MRSRLTQFALILTTMLALLASSVSACACGHHEIKSVEPAMPSCHHGSVATAAAVEENADAEAIDAACICYVNLPSPFVIGKSEQRSVELKKQAPAVLPDVYFIKAERIVTTTTLAAVRSVTPIYLSRELTFTPSRAPPRL